MNSACPHLTEIGTRDHAHTTYPHGRQKYAALWTNEFSRFLEATTGRQIDPVIADGHPHPAGPKMEYLLDLDGPYPNGYVEGSEVFDNREGWIPSYRNAGNQIDAGQLLAGNGGPYTERPFDIPREIFLADTRLRSSRDVVPAVLESIRPTRLAPAKIRGTEIFEIEIGIRSPFGVATILVPIYTWYLPPGCGTLAPGGRMALKLTRVAPETARLDGILASNQIVEVRR